MEGRPAATAGGLDDALACLQTRTQSAGTGFVCYKQLVGAAAMSVGQYTGESHV